MEMSNHNDNQLFYVDRLQNPNSSHGEFPPKTMYNDANSDPTSEKNRERCRNSYSPKGALSDVVDDEGLSEDVKHGIDHRQHDKSTEKDASLRLLGDETKSEVMASEGIEEKEEALNTLLHDLAKNSVLWNVLLYCSDGQIYQNKLTCGLVFPELASSDTFHVLEEPVLLLPDITIAQLHSRVHDKLTELSRRAYKVEAEDEESNDVIEDIETVESEEAASESTPLVKRKRGRPKGSISKRKKIKSEQGEDSVETPSQDDPKASDVRPTRRRGRPPIQQSSTAEVDETIKEDPGMGDEDEPDEDNEAALNGGRASSAKSGGNFMFPVKFDLEKANNRFNSLLEDVRRNSKQITEGDTDKKIRWECSMCGDVCSNLAIHVGRNHSANEFQCSQCETKVGSEYLLKVHEKTHIAEALPCNLCGKVVKDMKNHLVQIHDEGETKNRIKCPQCPKIYVKNAEFQRHFNSTHLGIKANCPICQKELLPNKVASHVRMVHDKVKNHFCPNCGKGFYDKRDMELHIQRIHLGTKELCIECGKELSAGQLKKHIQKCHSGENTKVICPVCGKKVGYLEEHMRSVHKKEKNHQCPLCPLKVYKRNTLKRHLEWHEKGKMTVNGTPKKPRILKKNKDDQSAQRTDESQAQDPLGVSHSAPSLYHQQSLVPSSHLTAASTSAAAGHLHHQLSHANSSGSTHHSQQQQQQQQAAHHVLSHHHQQQQQDQQQQQAAANNFPGFPDPASIMNLANLYRGHHAM